MLSKIFFWLSNNDKFAYSLIRIFLGIALFVRGMIFAYDIDIITKIANAQSFYWWYSYITIVHIIGGFMLAVGFITRLASFIQLPILFVAVFFVHLHQGLTSGNQSLELSSLVFFLLLIYLFFGSGSISIDNYLTQRRRKNTQNEK